MTSRLTTFSLACLAAMMLLAIQASVHATDVVHFTSAVLPPSPLKLRQAKAQGKEMKQEPGLPLWGHLNKPAGTGPFPAVVLMHGCNGIRPTHARWASQLTELGYVTLILDSLGPRSIFDVCKTPLRIASPQTRAFDAHGALAYLQGLPFVDGARIGIVGWSHGGNSVLAAVNNIGITAKLPQRFKAAIVFYPFCIGGGDYILPTLILLGEADEWGPLSQCQELKAQSNDGGASIELVAYPGVFHAFDVLELKNGLSVEGGLYGKTYWVQYNKKAHEDAAKRVKLFLAEHLSLR
jgi:dienelactone hydrolase